MWNGGGCCGGDNTISLTLAGTTITGNPGNSSINIGTLPTLTLTSGTLNLVDASGTHPLQSIAGDLYYGGELLAKSTDLQIISEWAQYPAATTVNANNFGVVNVAALNFQAGSGHYGSINNVQNINGAIGRNLAIYSSGSTVMTANIAGVANFAQAPQTTDVPAVGADLTNKSYVDTAVSGAGAGWANYPAVNNVNLAGNDIFNVSSFTAGGTLSSFILGSGPAPLLEANTFAGQVNIIGYAPVGNSVNLTGLSTIDMRSEEGGINIIAEAGEINVTATDVNLTSTDPLSVMNLTAFGPATLSAGSALLLSGGADVSVTAIGFIDIQAAGAASFVAGGAVSIAAGDYIEANSSELQVINTTSGQSLMSVNQIQGNSHSGGDGTLSILSPISVGGTLDMTVHDIVNVNTLQVGTLNYPEVNYAATFAVDVDATGQIVFQNKNTGPNASAAIFVIEGSATDYMGMQVNSASYSQVDNTLFELPSAGIISHTVDVVIGPGSDHSANSRTYLTYKDGHAAHVINEHGAVSYNATYAGGTLTLGNYGVSGELVISQGITAHPIYTSTPSVSSIGIIGTGGGLSAYAGCPALTSGDAIYLQPSGTVIVQDLAGGIPSEGALTAGYLQATTQMQAPAILVNGPTDIKLSAPSSNILDITDTTGTFLQARMAALNLNSGGGDLALFKQSPTRLATTDGITDRTIAYLSDLPTSSALAAASFSSTANQTVTAANTPTTISHNTTDYNSGDFHLDASGNIVADVSGVFQVITSIQFDKTDGGSDIGYFWIRINGANVPNTTTSITLANANAADIATVPFMVEMDAGDVLSIVMASADATWFANAQLVQVLPYFRPALPSIITTLQKLTATSLGVGGGLVGGESGASVSMTQHKLTVAASTANMVASTTLGPVLGGACYAVVGQDLTLNGAYTQTGVSVQKVYTYNDGTNWYLYAQLSNCTSNATETWTINVQKSSTATLTNTIAAP